MVKQNLVIVESPTKAKTIERYLGKNFKVVASKGHLRDLPKSKMGVDIEHNYEPHYISIRGKGDLIKSLKKEAAKADAKKDVEAAKKEADSKVEAVKNDAKKDLVKDKAEETSKMEELKENVKEKATAVKKGTKKVAKKVKNKTKAAVKKVVEKVEEAAK